jgi:hypothetical protein
MCNVDELSNNKVKIFGQECIAKPLIRPFWLRVKDSIKVITGEAVAVTFTENIQIKPLIQHNLNKVFEEKKEFNKILRRIGNLPKDKRSTINVLKLKLVKDLSKMGVEFINDDEIKIRKYTFNNNKFSIKRDDEYIDIKDNETLGNLWESLKIKYICDRILQIFESIKANKDYMLKN